jgi:hypothetical protein
MDRKNPKIAGIEHFPVPIKDGLTLVRELIVDKFQPEMIILFGSLQRENGLGKATSIY